MTLWRRGNAGKTLRITITIEMKKDSLAVVSATFATSYMEARYFFTFKFLQLLSFQSYCLDALKNERLSSWHFEIIMIVFDIHLNSFWVVLGIWTWCITVVTITMKCPLSSGHKFCKGNKTESRLRIWIFLCLCKENCKLVFSALSLFFCSYTIRKWLMRAQGRYVHECDPVITIFVSPVGNKP